MASFEIIQKYMLILNALDKIISHSRFDVDIYVITQILFQLNLHLAQIIIIVLVNIQSYLI